MAEIPVEKKSGKGWLWILLALLVIALLAWWLLDNDGRDTVEYTEDEATEVVDADPASLPEPVAAAAGVTIADILGNPAEYVGDSFEDEVTAAEVPTDRGFWVEDQGQRLFAVLADQPREVPIDIDPGEEVRITEGVLRDATFLTQLSNIDPDTRGILEDQEIFLVVDEENVQALTGSGN